MCPHTKKRGGLTGEVFTGLSFLFCFSSQVASLLLADDLWDKVRLQWPEVLGKENPFNAQIEQVFGDQGGH